MPAILGDVRGGCSIIRRVALQILILIVVETALMLFLSPRTPIDMTGGQLQALIAANKSLGFAVIFAIMIAASIVPLFYSVEIARVGAERRSGSKPRFRLLPSFRLIWVVMLLFLLSIFVAIFVGVALFFVYILLSAADTRMMFVFQLIREYPPLSYIDAAMLVKYFTLLVLQLLGLFAAAFLVSRFALIPIMIHCQGLTFRAAWRRQIDVFDRHGGSIRARFFWIVLVLILLAAGLEMATTMLDQGNLVAWLLEISVSFFLVVILPVAILTHMVYEHPVREPDTGDMERTGD